VEGWEWAGATQTTGHTFLSIAIPFTCPHDLRIKGLHEYVTGVEEEVEVQLKANGSEQSLRHKGLLYICKPFVNPTTKVFHWDR